MFLFSEIRPLSSVIVTPIMVALASLIVLLSAVPELLAAPANTAKRGPHDLVLRGPSSLSRRSAINYDQDYTTGGTVNYSPTSTGFSVQWNTQNDFVVGVGWTTGTTACVNSILNISPICLLMPFIVQFPSVVLSVSVAELVSFLFTAGRPTRSWSTMSWKTTQTLPLVVR